MVYRMNLGLNSPEFSRNYGFWNMQDQKRLCEAHVAIAGVGGDGFELGLTLARMGVSRFSIADPEVFERENMNRVPGAEQATLGKNKADVFEEKLHAIRPDAKVSLYKEGVQPENVSDFMHGASLVLDESELTHLEIGTLIAREARKLGIPNLFIMNVGFAAEGTSFRPSGKITFEKMMGVPDGAPLDEVKEMPLRLDRCLPYVPTYADVRTLMAVQTDDSTPLPSIAPGVNIASGMGATQAFLHITNHEGTKHRQPTWAPRFRWIDAYTGRGGETRYPRMSHYKNLGFLLLRDTLGLNASASYASDERLARELATS